MYRYEHSNIGMSVCIHDKGCTCHSVALSSSVCEGWPEQLCCFYFCTSDPIALSLGTYCSCYIN